MTGLGLFPTWIDVYVWVKIPYYDSPGYYMKQCFSGVQGKGFQCRSKDGATLPFVVPPCPIDPPRPDTPLPFNPFDMYVETTDGSLSYTATGILTVVHRTYTTNSYTLRASFPPPFDVGIRSIDSEEYDG